MAAAKKKIEKLPKEKIPTASIMDFIKWLTTEKRKWEDLKPQDQKAFNPFILNRFLSMNYDLCEAINDLQQWTIGMDKDKVWRVYYELLPARWFSIQYIKAQEVEGLTEKDIKIFKKYFSVNEEVAIDYFKTLNRTNEGQEKIEQLRRNYTYEKFEN